MAITFARYPGLSLGWLLVFMVAGFRRPGVCAVSPTMADYHGGLAGSNVEVVKGKHGLFAVPTDDMYIGASLRVYGEWSEGENMDVFSTCIKEGDVVLDIGANLGSFTVPMSRHVGRSGLVHAFEPMGLNFRLLATNIVLNGLQNVELHRVFATGPEDAGKVSYTTEFTDELFQRNRKAGMPELLNYGSYSMDIAANGNGKHVVPHLTVGCCRWFHAPGCSCGHIHTQACMHIQAHACICTHVHINAHMLTHIIHTHTHMHTKIPTDSLDISPPFNRPVVPVRTAIIAHDMTANRWTSCGWNAATSSRWTLKGQSWRCCAGPRIPLPDLRPSSTARWTRIQWRRR